MSRSCGCAAAAKPNSVGRPSVISVHDWPAVVAAVHADSGSAGTCAVRSVRRQHELVHAVADLRVLERPVRAQARCCAASTTRRRRSSRRRRGPGRSPRSATPRRGAEDRGDAEVAGRLVRRVVPGLAVRLAFEQAQERPRCAAVAALEHAGASRRRRAARPCAARQAGHLRDLELAACRRRRAPRSTAPRSRRDPCSARRSRRATHSPRPRRSRRCPASWIAW